MITFNDYSVCVIKWVYGQVDYYSSIFLAGIGLFMGQQMFVVTLVTSEKCMKILQCKRVNMLYTKWSSHTTCHISLHVCFFVFFIQSKQRQLNDLYVGSQVIAKHKNGRYYHATITEVTRSKLYEVDFDDGSVSFDLLPEDIVVSMIAQVFILSR